MRSGSIGNPKKGELSEVHRKQHPVKGLDAFVAPPDAAVWLLQSQLMPRFAERFAKEPGWVMTYEQGICYVFSYQSNWQGFEDILRVAGGLELAMRGN